TTMALGPIASATCLRRAANSSTRLVLSNTGAGGVIRIAAGAGAALSPLAPTSVSAHVESKAASARINAKPDGTLLVIINSWLQPSFLKWQNNKMSNVKIENGHGRGRRRLGFSPGGKTRVVPLRMVTMRVPSGLVSIVTPFGKVLTP